MNETQTEIAQENRVAPPPQNCSLTFYKTVDGKNIPVGVLDFNGPFMKFQGAVDESAIALINYVAAEFQKRLSAEYWRGFEDGRMCKENAQ